MVILHTEYSIGVKQLSEADLGISETSHQTHIGLSEKVFSFLPDEANCVKGVLVYNGSCSSVDCLFSKINDNRSTKIKLGEDSQKKSLARQIRSIASSDQSVNWFIVWFALFDGTPVFWLFKENSNDYNILVSFCELVGTKNITPEKKEFYYFLREINTLDQLKELVNEKVKNSEGKILITSSDKLTIFVRMTLRFFESFDNLKLVSNHFNKCVENEPISVFEENSYNLQNMFICTNLDQIKKRNSPRTRWYTDSFCVNDSQLYLYNDWYETKSGDASRLYLDDLIAMYRSCYGTHFSYRKIGNVHEFWLNKVINVNADNLPKMNTKEKLYQMDSVIASIKSSGLIYDDLLIKRFSTSLLTKPFVILSGLAGSGKTQLALAFAKALVSDEDKQMCVVPVGADWTNREPLLGYPNALKNDEYVRPESGVLDLLIEANKPENSSKPYFLILDEMNLSYVERYFADFLSAMESHKAIKLWNVESNATPKSVELPKNLFIIGTINVDETTYMFSPKVLDRANVIEFKVSESEMQGFLDVAPNVDLTKIEKIDNQSADFVKLAQNHVALSPVANDELVNFFKELKKVNAEFGYRTATEIGRFISLALAQKSMKDSEAIDSAIVQKLLPKLHGSRKKIVPVLANLWGVCVAGQKLEDVASIDDADDIKYPLSADKIWRMYQCAIENGFTSFAEA